MFVSNGIPRRPPQRTTKLQVVENIAKTRTELADSVHRMMTCHGKSPYQVMRMYGLSLEDVMELFFDAEYRRDAVAIRTAFANGRSSMMPMPAVVMRRAA